MGEVEGKSFRFGPQDDTMKSNLIEIMIVARAEIFVFFAVCRTILCVVIHDFVSYPTVLNR